MIAYLILVHRFPNQFKRLFNAIYHPDNYYVIHVDKKSGVVLEREVKAFVKDFPNVAVLRSKKTLWGGYSLVDAELRGIKKLLKMGRNWQFFINLSAQDFPLKTQNQIHDYLLQNLGKDFLKVSDQQKIRPETMGRVENYVTDSGEKMISEPVAKRDFIDGVTPYIGNQWVILSRRFCYFLTTSQEVTKFSDFYEHTLIADEGFFQTVIMNTSYNATIVNDDKREIDWVPSGPIKLRPRDFTTSDAAMLMQSTNLFARKFDETVDENILTILEDHLTSQYFFS